MRKQYHFRQVENDTYIWDVDQLLQLSQALPVFRLPLTAIAELNEAYWYPDHFPTTQEIIEHMQLIQAADLAYPIILCAQGRLMDGMHRVAKAKMLQQEHILAVRFNLDPAPNFINLSADQLCYDESL